MSDNKSHNSKTENKGSQNSKISKDKKSESSTPEKKFDPFTPDLENPYNNMTIPAQVVPEPSRDDLTLLCYFCKTLVKVENDWKMFECSLCHRMNKMPQKLINKLYFEEKLKNIRCNSYLNHLDMILPLPFIIVVCPFCKAENKVKNKISFIDCFICGRGFSIDYTEDKILSNEKVSLNPNSKFYRYNTDKPTVLYPPVRSMRIPSRFFPEPDSYEGLNMYNGEFPDKFYSNFKWDHNNHNLNYIPPMKRNYTPKINYNNLNNFADEKILQSLSEKNLKRESEKSELYKKLFFMKQKYL